MPKGTNQKFKLYRLALESGKENEKERSKESRRQEELHYN